MERNYLICLLVGQLSASDKSMTADTMRIKIDELLTNACFTPIGTEDGDLQLMEELLGETMMYVMGQGINRKMRRNN